MLNGSIAYGAFAAGDEHGGSVSDLGLCERKRWASMSEQCKTSETSSCVVELDEQVDEARLSSQSNVRTPPPPPPLCDRQYCIVDRLVCFFVFLFV